MCYVLFCSVVRFLSFEVVLFSFYFYFLSFFFNDTATTEIYTLPYTTLFRSPVLALGVSLGGIILGNYLAEQKEAVVGLLDAAMLVSVCFDTFRGTESLEKRGLNLMLNRHLANCLIDSIKEVQHHFMQSSQWDLDDVYKSQTIKEFDERFTCRQFGYSSYREYYTHAKIKGKIGQIKIPVLALNAEDDPFSPGDSLPLEEAKRSDHFAMLTTAYGGHIGFMEGLLPTRYHFSDRVYQQFANAVFNHLIPSSQTVS